MPGILHDIVSEALRGARDVVVVGDVASACDPLETEIARTNPAVVVVGAEHPAVADGVSLLGERARPKVIAVGANGAQATLHELLLHSTPLGELSPGALVSAIRQAGAAA